MLKILFYVIMAEIFASIGQIFFKKTTNSLSPYAFGRIDTHISFLKEIFANPKIWIGLFATVLGLIFWLMALSQGALSLVFTIGSIQYILILFLAHAFLDEKIDSMKLIGTLLVTVGIVFITLS